MATEYPVWDHGDSVAAADYSAAGAAQFRAVKITAANTFGLATVAGERVLGILQDRPAAGMPGSVRVLGKSKVVSSAAFAAGSPLATDAVGKAVASATAGHKVFGIALEAATAADQIVSAIIFPAWII